MWGNLRFEDTSNYAPQAPARALRISLCLYLVLVLIECTILRDLNGDPALLAPSSCDFSRIIRGCTIYTIHGRAGEWEVAAALESKKLPSSSRQIKCLKRRIQKNICKRVEMRRQPVMVQGKQQQLEMGESKRKIVNKAIYYICLD